MTVTDFHKTKRGKIALYLDGEFFLSMYPEVFAASGLAIGMELDEEQLRELAAEAELKKAKEKALGLLSYKEYTTKELEQRLRRHVDGDAAAGAVERMEELGLVDDEDYAVRYARDLSNRKGFGAIRIKQEMKQKGLSADQIEFALSLLEDDPEEKIRAVLEKKYPLALEDEKVKRRAFAGLLRLGYNASDVRRVLSAMNDGWYED